MDYTAFVTRVALLVVILGGMHIFKTHETIGGAVFAAGLSLFVHTA